MGASRAALYYSVDDQAVRLLRIEEYDERETAPEA